MLLANVVRKAAQLEDFGPARLIACCDPPTTSKISELEPEASAIVLSA
jgi:hypothetical protein